MQSVKATQVAIEVSGVAITATVAAGTMIPPTPRLLKVPRIMARVDVSGVMDASEPVNAAMREVRGCPCYSGKDAEKVAYS